MDHIDPATGKSMTIRIRRTKGEFASFTVAVEKHTTLLDAFEEIRASQDPTLVYRHSCHHGSCGTCGVLVDGERVLACLTTLSRLDEEPTVGPLAGFPVIADLAVDPTPLYRGFPRDASYLRDSDVNREAVPPEEIDRFSRFENCIECGLCVSACPVVGPFNGPAALAAFGRELEQRPDRAGELLPQIAGPDGATRCERALVCSAVCPLGVAPAKHIAVLQRKLSQSSSAQR